jgi:hypothetical protein
MALHWPGFPFATIQPDLGQDFGCDTVVEVPWWRHPLEQGVHAKLRSFLMRLVSDLPKFGGLLRPTLLSRCGSSQQFRFWRFRLFWRNLDGMPILPHGIFGKATVPAKANASNAW